MSCVQGKEKDFIMLCLLSRGTLLSRSDSAYGESMRSSSPSPVMTPVSRSYDGHLDGPFTHVSTYSSHEERVGNSYSPRSDTNNNGKSSGKATFTFIIYFVMVSLATILTI